jgi:hypothetical protein
MAVLTTILTVGTIAAAVLGVGHGAGAHFTRKEPRKELDKQYDRFYANLNKSPLNDYDVYEVLGKMWLDGAIDEDYYNKAIKTLKQYEDAMEDEGGWDHVSDMFKKNTINKATLKELSGLYGKMADYNKDVANYTSALLNMSGEDVKNVFNESVPNIPNMPAPEYFDTNIDPFQIDVEPAKIWTNQELADHHNINYDLNNYYDLIKQGTEANVNLGKYQSAQMANAALQNNTASNVSYLDSIRQSKANAMAEGATLGARAANDLLANMTNLNTFAENQATVAQNRYNAVDAYLQADAQAKIQANNYFTKLASSLWNDSASLYYSDTDMSSQGYKTNATLHGADRNLAGKNAYLNGTMLGNYADAQAQVEAAASGAQAQADEYAWVFDRFLGANKGNVALAIRDMDNYLFNRYSGYKNPYDYLLDNADDE